MLSHGVQVRDSLGCCTECILPPAGSQQVDERVGSCRYSHLWIATVERLDAEDRIFRDGLCEEQSSRQDPYRVPGLLRTRRRVIFLGNRYRVLNEPYDHVTFASTSNWL